MNKFIFDKLTRTPTILATDRAKRVDQTGGVSGKVKDHTDGTERCFFCKGSESETPLPVYQDMDDWNVRAFQNKFPLVENHEIIVHSPIHDKDISDLPHEQNVKIIRAFLNRLHHFTSQEKEVLFFNNRGGRAGASIFHPHSQIIALKGFPGIIEREKDEALAYYNEYSSCYWCDLIKKEKELSQRVVFESDHFMLIVPEASRWSYELKLLPKVHRPNFGFIDEMEINDFARIMKAALRAYDELFDKPDRNFWIHTQRFDPYHWHVGFMPHIKVLGGLELGSGIWVSDKATPEDSSIRMGEIVKRVYESERVSIAYEYSLGKN